MKSFLLGAKTEVQSWVNPYVTDGLVAMWDGEWNAGGGLPHDSSANVWKDICGNYDATFNGDMANVTWNERSVSVGGSSLYFKTETYIPCVQVDDVYTAEVVFSGAQIGTDTTVLGVPCNSSGGFGLVRGQLWGSMIVRANYDTNPTIIGVTIPGTGYSSIIHAVNSSDGMNKKLTTRFGGSSLEATAPIQRNYSLIDAHMSLAGGKDERATSRTLYCARIYNRVLSDAEVSANYAIDARRFGL